MLIGEDKIKILIYASNVLFEGNRGDSTHVRELVQNLSELGHKIIVIACNTHRNLYDKFDLYGIKYYTDNLILKLFISIYGFILGIIVLIKLKPDLIYKRQSSLGEDILIAKLARCPIITEINGITSEESGSSKKTLLHRVIKNILAYISEQSIFSSDYLVVVTPNIKSIISNVLNISTKKIIILIPNGANTELFRPIAQEKAKSELKLCQDGKYICFVGNLAPWQGVEYLIRAAPHILKADHSTRFLIVGDGSMKMEWVRLVHNLGISDKFIFTGSVPYEQVPKYINAGDVCVVSKKPLKSGFSPLKLYEYMACGKPVIATRTDGFEILEKYNAGLLINPENSREFADAVIRLIQNEYLRKLMGANGRKYVVENHSWASVAKKVSDVCESAIQEYNKKEMRHNEWIQ